MQLNRIALAGLLVVLATTAAAQVGVRGQIFLPNGAPLQRQIRFTLSTDNGMFTETYFTDSNGRLAIPRQAGPYTITVPTDERSYDTTMASFNPVHAGSHISIHLKPFNPRAAAPPGVVNASEMEQKVAPKAKEAYDAAAKLLAAGQYEQAIAPLQHAIAVQPDYFRAHNDLGVTYLKLDRLDEAVAALRQAIKLNNQNHLPQLNLGLVLNRQSQHREAADVLSQLARRHPELAIVRAPLIEALIGAQAWAAAEEQIRKAQTLKDADAADLQIKLGVVLVRQKKFAEAITTLREAAQAKPDAALAHFNLGAALFATDQLNEAETALRRAYQLAGAQMAGAQLLLGQVYFQQQKYPQALAAFETYLRDLPEAPNAAQVKEAIRKLRESRQEQ